MQDPRKLTFLALAALTASATVAAAQSAPPPPLLSPGGQTEIDRQGNPPASGSGGFSPAPATPRTSQPPRPLTSDALPFNGTLDDLADLPYTLGAGDSVNVQVFNVPEFSGTFPVGIDGKLRIPLLGPIDAEGLTLDELAEILIIEFEPIVQRPLVTADLAAPRPARIAIYGEIANPGSYALPSQGVLFSPLSEVVRGAGGITQAADVRRIQLVRMVGDTPRELEVDLFDLLAQGNLSRDIRLRDGDRIFIPTTQAYSPTESRLLTVSTVAGDATLGAAEVAVVGEVNRPGTYTAAGGGENRPPTVTTAILAAGGITNLSDLRGISVRRPTRSGEEQIIPANLWETLVSGDLSQDIILYPGDTVVVPRADETLPEEESALASASFAPATITVNLIGEVNGPGAISVPSNTPLSQAILSAGGLRRGRAKRSNVQLVRLNPNGTVTTRKFKYDVEAPIDTAENPTLRNRDTVIVGRNFIAQFADTADVLLLPFSRIFQIIDTVDDISN